MTRPQPQSNENATRTRWRFLANEGSRLSAFFTRPANQKEAENFSALYRRSATELARVRAFSPNRRQVEFLEQAVAAAHFAIHRGERTTIGYMLRALFFGFPDLVRRYWRYHMLALAITLGCAAIAYFAVMHDSSTYYLFIDSGLAGGRNPSASREFLERSLLDGREGDADSLAFFSVYLFQHNTLISFLCFALGIGLGLPTMYLLIVNGLMLGGFIALYARVGLEVELLAWLLPHGVPEIGSIVLCGGAGLSLGHTMLNPGNMSRADALKARVGDAAMTVMACVPLLLLAAIVEGFFRQSEASTEIRYALFGFFFCALGAWILFVRKPWQAPSWGRLKAGDIAV